MKKNEVVGAQRRKRMRGGRAKSGRVGARRWREYEVLGTKRRKRRVLKNEKREKNWDF